MCTSLSLADSSSGTASNPMMPGGLPPGGNPLDPMGAMSGSVTKFKIASLTASASASCTIQCERC